MKTDHASNKIIHHIVHPNKKKKEYTPQSNDISNDLVVLNN